MYKSTFLLFFPSLLIILLLSASCHKKRATESLAGTWNVVGAEGGFISACDTFIYRLYEQDTLLGSVIFDEDVVHRNYRLFDDQEGCYDHSNISDEVDWMVLEHQRIKIAVHRYVLSIGDEEWSAVFGENRTGEPAANQDFLYLARIGEGSSLLYLELERAK